MADSTTDYNNLDPLGDEAAVVDEVDAAVSGARKKPRAVDMVPEEPDATVSYTHLTLPTNSRV